MPRISLKYYAVTLSTFNYPVDQGKKKLPLGMKYAQEANIKSLPKTQT